MADNYTYTVELNDLVSGPITAAASQATLFQSAMSQAVATTANATAPFQKAAQGVTLLNQVEQTTTTNTSSLSSSLGTIVSRISDTINPWQTLKSAINLGADLEQNRLRFQTYLGSVEKGNAMIKELSAMADVTPLSNEEIVNASSTLLNLGVSADKVIPTLQAIGNVSGGNSENFQAISSAFANTSSSGKLMEQDLIQMINAGFNPLQEISRQTGLGMDQLKNSMNQGAISSEMIQAAFKSATSEGGTFHDMMNQQSETLSGKWTTLVGLFQGQIGTLMEQYINPLITGLMDIAISVVGTFSGIASALGNNLEIVAILAVGIGALVAQTVWLTTVSKAQAFWTSIMTAKQWLLNLAMKDNPIGFIIAGIALLIAGIVLAYKKLDWFRNFVDSVWGAIKGMFTAVASLFGLADEEPSSKKKPSAKKQATPTDVAKTINKTTPPQPPTPDPIWDSLHQTTNKNKKNQPTDAIIDNVSTAGDKKSTTYNITIQKVLEMRDQIVQGTQQEADALTDMILDNLTRRMAGTFRSATSG